ncbi:MAG TPA: hypothetical protein VNB24_00580 [Acidimicrobiales bacterium]|nr:hypothetical protein [Acidimicrobiales bacterium]
MRLTRVAATATALAIAAAATTSGPVQAASGVGTSAASTSLLDIALGTNGSLLGVKILNDEARATIDPTVASPEAFSRLAAASVSSSVLPAPLNSVTVPVLESRSPGGAGLVSGPALDLAKPLPTVTVPSALLAGSVAPATLTSAVDATGARSSLAAALGSLSLVGGLVSVDAVTSSLTTTAKPTSADGSRTVKADGVTVLDLGALLDGVGLPLGSLPVGTVSTILTGLGVPVPGVPASTNVADFVTTLNGTIDTLQDQIDGNISTTVGTTADPILSGLGLPVPDTGDAVATVQSVVDQVQALIADILADALAALDGLKLLEVDGVEVGTITKATDTVAGSTAGLVARVGSISLGGIELPGVDLASTVATVNGLVSDVNSRLSSTLGAVSPGLANLVSISMFDKDPATGVTSAAGYTKAVAGITALTTKITPPADLAAIVAGLPAAGGIASAITSAGGTVPALSTVMGTFENLLGTSVQALAGGATLKLASVNSGASFTTPVASTGGTLPRTGSPSQVALFGFGLAVAALVGRRAVLAQRAS